jgi:hypothetical protein
MGVSGGIYIAVEAPCAAFLFALQDLAGKAACGRAAARWHGVRRRKRHRQTWETGSGAAAKQLV